MAARLVWLRGIFSTSFVLAAGSICSQDTRSDGRGACSAGQGPDNGSPWRQLIHTTWRLHSRQAVDSALTGASPDLSIPLFSRARLDSCLQVGIPISADQFDEMTHLTHGLVCDPFHGSRPSQPMCA